MMRMACFMRAKVQLYVETTKDFFDFLRFCIVSEKDRHTSFVGVGLEETISYCSESGLAR